MDRPRKKAVSPSFGDTALIVQSEWISTNGLDGDCFRLVASLGWVAAVDGGGYRGCGAAEHGFCSASGQALHVSGHDAQGECAERAQAETDRRGDGDPGERDAVIAAFMRVPAVHGDQQAQVIEAGHAGVQQANHAEQPVMPLQNGRENVEFAKESARERNADHRQQEQAEQRTQPGTAQRGTGVVLYRAVVLIIATKLGHHRERADVHGRIGGGVESGGGDSVTREGGERGQQVAGVGNGGVGQHALDVLLPERAKVAD